MLQSESAVLEGDSDECLFWQTMGMSDRLTVPFLSVNFLNSGTEQHEIAVRFSFSFLAKLFFCHVSALGRSYCSNRYSFLDRTIYKCR